MLKKITLGTAAALTALSALPAAAEAHGRDRYSDRGRYEQSYRGDRYSNRYDDRRYYNQRNYNRRCKGTTGLIVGGVGGALLGREVGRGSRNRYGYRNSGTTGTILGGAIGALAGRAIDKSNCRR